MQRPGTRRSVWMLASVLLTIPWAGCTSNEVPLVVFPQGAPPPPAAAKNVEAPQGSNTSQGEPSH